MLDLPLEGRVKVNYHDHGVGRTQRATHICLPLLLLLVEGLQSPFLLSVRIFFFYLCTNENLCGNPKPAKTKCLFGM